MLLLMVSLQLFFDINDLDFNDIFYHLEMWLSYGKEGFRKFRSYVDDFVIPNLLKKAHFEVFNKRQVKTLIFQKKSLK